MNGWELGYDDFSPDHEALREALCTLGNGYFATRGAAPEVEADDVHYPGTYVAGCYNRLRTRIEGETVENECLVNVPNWLPLTFRIDAGPWFRLDDVEVLSYRQELQIHHAMLSRTIRFRDGAGRTTRLSQHRLVSMDHPHLAALETVIHAEDWSGELAVRAALDGRVVNGGVARYKALNNHHLTPIRAESTGPGTFELQVETNQSHVRIAQAARMRCWRDDRPVELDPLVEQAPGYVGHVYPVALTAGESLRIEKLVAMYTSRDHAITEPALEAARAAATADGFPELARRHRVLWAELWKRFDFAIELEDASEADETDETERTLRLHILHLIQTTSPHNMDLDAGVPARGLHGEAYRGHVFWDELFVFPLFDLRMPEITQALLRYRYRRLGEARRAAREAGLRGAMFPWQSGSNGREESQRLHLNPRSGNWNPDRSHRQRHISAAVAYNTWRHFEVTRDMDFLTFFGAEIILEVARFWASLATFDEQQQRYHICGVMGPDEYHDGYPDTEEPGIDDNAYTNVMAVWTLLRALELRRILPQRRLQELCRLLELTGEEFDRWERVTRRMYVPFHDQGRIISQFEGYEQLEAFDWEGYRRKYGDIQRLDRILEAEDDTPNRYQVSKQADVLMLFYLFSAEELGELFDHLDYPFDHETIPRNIDYYLSRTSHGSTLSRVVHSWVLARSDRPGGWPLFREALASDITDIQGGTTEEGIHTGAMAGTVDLMQRCFTGIATREDVLWLNPCLPKGLKCVSLNIHYRQNTVDILVRPGVVRVGTEAGMDVGIRSQVYRLEPGEARDFRL